MSVARESVFSEADFDVEVRGLKAEGKYIRCARWTDIAVGK